MTTITREFVSSVTKRGHLTLPAEVRRHLGVGPDENVTFVIDEEGRVLVRRPKYPTIESLRGIAGKLSKPLPWDEVMRIAHEDAATGNHT